ncbi:MAG: hypothetical protein AABX54_04325 [Nanoarchaeota archaeon]
MENRISKIFRDRNHASVQQFHEIYCNQMVESEETGHYYFALEENNLAYDTAFTLYLMGMDKQLQIQRMEDLAKKAEEYLKQLNQNTRLA